MATAKQTEIGLGALSVLGTIAGILFLVKTGQWMVLAVSIAVTSLGLAVWGFLGAPIYFRSRLTYSCTALLVGSCVLAIFTDRVLLRAIPTADFSSEEIRIYQLASVPRCNAQISGEAPVAAGGKVWVAHRETGKDQYYLTPAERVDSESPNWLAKVIVGGPGGTLSFEFFAFIASERGDAFLRSRGAAIVGAKPGLVFFGKLPPGATDRNKMTTTRQADLGGDCPPPGSA